MRAETDRLIRELRALPPRETKLMEICGTHTMAIARAGLKSLLPEGTVLLSGPGCPVCVTASRSIDAVLRLAMEKNVVIASYGDMLRVPGSCPGDSLLRRRAQGARVELVYSPVDAVALAEQNPDKDVVFLGVGFETTAPGTAAAVLSARERGVKNFSVWSMLKSVKPALRALLAQADFAVEGFLCPGHVATIVGAEAFRFLSEDYGRAAVVGGFEPEDILRALLLLLRQLHEGKPRLENAYPQAVAKAGNRLAQETLARCFSLRTDEWRGLGTIENSGFALKEEFAAFDAEKRFPCRAEASEPPTACRCGDVICGRCRPADCPLFETRCTQEDPVGPCMVSSEGACAAASRYRSLG